MTKEEMQKILDALDRLADVVQAAIEADPVLSDANLKVTLELVPNDELVGKIVTEVNRVRDEPRTLRYPEQSGLN